MTRAFKGFIFDLDGTLLDTLPDLTVVTNKALEAQGFPTHTQEEILGFVGNGALRLIQMACPSNASTAEVQAVLADFKAMYAEFGLALTQHFPGMPETLAQLKERGAKLGIVSNKFEQGVKDVEAAFFPAGLFDSSHGESPTIPRKPDPTGVLLTAREMGIAPEECAYVGDSHTDMQVAHAAGMFAIGCTWGYQPLERLLEGMPDALVSSPIELLQFI